MVFIQKWGSARHAANASFLFAIDAKFRNLPTNSEELAFVISQLDYFLGDGPILDGAKGSLVVGMGENYPSKQF